MSARELHLDAPSERQRAFLLERHKHVAYGGARGGGKSWAVRAKAMLLCLQYAGIKVLILRRTYPELVNNHINTLVSTLRGVARYNDQKKILQFENGSLLFFGYCNKNGDLDRYQGAEYDVLFLDEATQLAEEWIRKLTACCRGANNFPKRVYYTCNPGGVSHQYIKRLFIDRRYEEGERGEEYAFIRALVTDNTALMRTQPDYVRQLEALPEKLRQAWLYGNWDIFEGQFFEDFRPEPDLQAAAKAGFGEMDAEALRANRMFCHVIEPFEVPNSWNVVRSYDFGYAKPFSCAWWAVDRDGRLYRILELYGCTRTPNEGVKWDPDRQAEEIRRVEKEHRWLKGRTIYGVADPAIFDASRGESIAETMAKHGVYWTPGDHERMAGWMQLHYRLAFDDGGLPMLYVFSSCKAFIRTMPLMMYSETHPEDLDTSLEDHVADEVRYMCMSRPIKPVERRQKQGPIGDDPLDILADEQKYKTLNPNRVTRKN